MKVFFILASMLASSMVYANGSCPNLQGKYHCFGEQGNNYALEIHQGQARGAIVYRLNDGWNPQVLIADNKVKTDVTESDESDPFGNYSYTRVSTMTRCVGGKLVKRYQDVVANDKDFRIVTSTRQGVELYSKLSGVLLIRMRGEQTVPTFKGQQKTPFSSRYRCQQVN